MKKVAILGGAGYIGHVLLDLYLRIEYDVTVYDKVFKPKMMTGGWYNYVQCDLTKHMPDLSSYDIIYNLAGITMTWSTDQEAVMSINRDAAIEAAKTSKRYIFASTNNVFGGYDKQQNNLTEESPKKPGGCYAQSKSDVEEWLKENHESWVALRFGSVFGYSDGLMYSPVGNVFILNALLNKPLTIRGDGLNTRPMIHIRDAARALFHAAHNNIDTGIYHCASRVKSLKSLAEEIKELHPSATITHDLENPDTFVGYEINTDKLKATGFEYKYDLTHAFNEMKRLFINVKSL